MRLLIPIATLLIGLVAAQDDSPVAISICPMVVYGEVEDMLEFANNDMAKIQKKMVKKIKNEVFNRGAKVELDIMKLHMNGTAELTYTLKAKNFVSGSCHVTVIPMVPTCMADMEEGLMMYHLMDDTESPMRMDGMTAEFRVSHVAFKMCDARAGFAPSNGRRWLDKWTNATATCIRPDDAETDDNDITIPVFNGEEVWDTLECSPAMCMIDEMYHEGYVVYHYGTMLAPEEDDDDCHRHHDDNHDGDHEERPLNAGARWHYGSGDYGSGYYWSGYYWSGYYWSGYYYSGDYGYEDYVADLDAEYPLADVIVAVCDYGNNYYPVNVQEFDGEAFEVKMSELTHEDDDDDDDDDMDYKILTCGTVEGNRVNRGGEFLHIYGNEDFECQFCPEEAGMFLCADSETCIPSRWICDGDNDCGDRSDEQNCQQMCTEQDRWCEIDGEGQCYPAGWNCDYFADCDDGRDELERGCECNNTCNNGMCIPDSWFCDWWDDCPDAEDEADCPCYQCEDSDECIPLTWQCDSERDCPSGDDEVDCPCPEDDGYMVCNGTERCVLQSWRCDGDNDCGDWEDEAGCECPSWRPIQCNNTAGCIASSWYCDGDNDCGDNEDETGCGNCGFTCDDGRCIPEEWICDTDFDCRDGEDEACELCRFREVDFYDYYYYGFEASYGSGYNPVGFGECEMDGLSRCILNEWICDGVRDCDDGADEMYCTSWLCDHEGNPDDYFMCHDWAMDHGPTCVHKELRCDKVLDCPDHSDENNCGTMREVWVDEQLVQVPLWLNPMSGEYVPVCDDSWPVDEVDDNGIPLADHETCRHFGFMGAEAPGSSIRRRDVEEANHGYVIMDRTTNSEGEGEWSVIEYVDACPENNRPRLLDCLPSEGARCGVRHADYRGFRWAPNVVRGEEAMNGSWPWQAGLFYSERFTCGATLISNEWAVTAAHCVEDREQNPDAFKVRLGTVNINSGYDVRVSEIIMHNNYRSDLIKNDIALLRLSHPVNYTAEILPICLPEPEHDFTGANSLECYVIGWGATNQYGTDYPEHLRQGRMHMINDEVCQNDFYIMSSEIFAPNKMLCAGYEHGYTTVCNGDSGGPLVCRNKDNVWTLAGVVSWGPVLPGISCMGISIFTEVTAFSNWIVDNTGVQLHMD